REARLAQMWEELLKVQPVGVRDNFFDLGGNSLLAAQLFLQVGRTFGKELPLSVLFEEGTVEHLARLIKEDLAGGEKPCLVAIHPRGGKPPFYCVHGVGGEVLSFEKLAKHLGPDQPFFGFQSRGLGSSAEPRHSVEEMAAAYVEELLQFQPEGPYRLGGYSCGAAIAYEMAQRLRADGHEVALLVLIDQRRPNLDSSFAWTRAGVTNFFRNVVPWFREDFLKSGWGNLLSRVRVKAG